MDHIPAENSPILDSSPFGSRLDHAKVEGYMPWFSTTVSTWDERECNSGQRNLDGRSNIMKNHVPEDDDSSVPSFRLSNATEI